MLAEDHQLELLLECCLGLDADDGRCRMVEDDVHGPPAAALRWCKTIVSELEALEEEISWLPIKVHMIVAATVATNGRIQVNFVRLRSFVEVRPRPQWLLTAPV